MSNQPIVFNIQYTPYSLPKNATKAEREQHASDRAFFDMTGDINIFEYMTTEEKRTGGYSMFDYLQKNTGVFNGKGMLPLNEIDQMKARLKNNKGNIYHGFISLSAEDSPKIDTPEKCIQMVRQIFPSFLRDAGFRPENIDLMCALHLDKPHHLHTHFVFWEKEPKIRDSQSGEMKYRRLGKIRKTAIDNMFVRLGLFFSDEKDVLYKSRDRAMHELKALLGAKAFIYSPDDIKKEILSLAKDLPKEGRITYGSKDMEPFRERVDKIVQMLILSDGKARKADSKFYDSLAKRGREIVNICGGEFVFSNKNIQPDEMELPKYHNKIDTGNIHIIDEIEADYKRRQGNLVLNLAKFIKPEYFESKRKHKANDKKLKKALSISRRTIDGAFKKFFSSFGHNCEYIERDFYHRLQEIEEEMEREREVQQNKTYNNQTK